MNEVKVGDFVQINGQDTIAEVLSVKGNDLEVAIGIMKMTLKKAKVTLADAPVIDQYEEEPENRIQSSGVDTKEKMMHFQFEFDIRGRMKEEIVNELSIWVDDALLLGVEQAKIIHGRGNGILRDTVRGMLRKFKEIEKLSDEAPERGGDSVTLVKFRI